MFGSAVMFCGLWKQSEGPQKNAAKARRSTPEKQPQYALKPPESTLKNAAESTPENPP